MRLRLYSAIAFLMVLGAALAYAPVHLSAWAPGSSGAVGPLVEYTDDVFHFAISYPAGYIVARVRRRRGWCAHHYLREPRWRACVPNIRGAVAESAITPERFKTDDPSGVMIDAKETLIDGVPAKSFFGYNDAMGDTREVWLIHSGFLFEVTTYRPLDAWLTPMLQTWKFI